MHFLMRLHQHPSPSARRNRIIYVPSLHTRIIRAPVPRPPLPPPPPGAPMLTYRTPFSGTTVTILRPRRKDDSADGFDDFKLMSVATWGENPAGKWTLEIRDDVSTTMPSREGCLLGRLCRLPLSANRAWGRRYGDRRLNSFRIKRAKRGNWRELGNIQWVHTYICGYYYRLWSPKVGYTDIRRY